MSNDFYIQGFSAYIKLPTPRPSASKPAVAPKPPYVWKEPPFAAHNGQVGNTGGLTKFTKARASESADIAYALNFSSLPKVNTQTFAGNPLEYHQFIRQFELLFKSVKDLEWKFQYLISYCWGKARQVIESCGKIMPSSRAYHKLYRSLSTNLKAWRISLMFTWLKLEMECLSSLITSRG